MGIMGSWFKTHAAAYNPSTYTMHAVQCMWSVHSRLCNPFHVCATLQTNPSADQRGQESGGVPELLIKPDKKKNTHIKKISKDHQMTCFTCGRVQESAVQALRVMTPSAALTFSYLGELHHSQHNLRLSLSAPGYKDGGVSAWVAHAHV